MERLQKLARVRQALPAAVASLEACRLCPRRCGVNRLADQSDGACGIGRWAGVASANLHFGEEPPISGERGSGTIFFTGCNLGCSFCQNWPISHLRHGRPVDATALADLMLDLQQRGAHNLNLVTASHVTPQILEGLALALDQGFDLPVLWNSNGYELPETLAWLDGIVDIYLPDAKCADPASARQFCDAPDYPRVNRAALAEMWRQVGAPRYDDDDILQRGLVVRHLVLPDDLSDTAQVLAMIQAISPAIEVSLMSQYFPAGEAVGHASLGRRLETGEYARARQVLEDLGLEGYTQEDGRDDHLVNVPPPSLQ